MTDERRPASEQPTEPPAWPSPPGAPAGGGQPAYTPPPAPPGQPPGQPPGGPPQWPAAPPVEPQPGRGAVHPLDVGRAFSVGWSLFRFRWRALIGATLVVMVPAYLIQAALTLYASDALDRWTQAASRVFAEAAGAGRQVELADLPAFPFAELIASFGSSIVVGIASVFVGAALIYIIGWTYGGSRPSAGQALRQSVNRLPSLVGAALLVGLVVFLVVFGGVVLTIALMAAVGFQPGPVVLLGFIAAVTTFAAVVFLAVRWLFYVQAIMLEGHGATAALGRSWRLVSGSSWRVLGYMLLLLLVVALIGIVAGFISIALFGLNVDVRTGQALPATPMQQVGQLLMSALVGIVITPFYSAVMTLLYYDLRWRTGEELGPPPA